MLSGLGHMIILSAACLANLSHHFPVLFRVSRRESGKEERGQQAEAEESYRKEEEEKKLKLK